MCVDQDGCLSVAMPGADDAQEDLAYLVAVVLEQAKEQALGGAPAHGGRARGRGKVHQGAAKLRANFEAASRQLVERANRCPMSPEVTMGDKQLVSALLKVSERTLSRGVRALGCHGSATAKKPLFTCTNGNIILSDENKVVIEVRSNVRGPHGCSLYHERPIVTFGNGSALTCGNIVFVFELVMKCEGGAHAQWLHRGAEEDVRLGPALRPYLHELWSTSHEAGWHLEELRRRLCDGGEARALGAFCRLVAGRRHAADEALLDAAAKGWLWAEAALEEMSTCLRLVLAPERGTTLRRVVGLPSWGRCSEASSVSGTLRARRATLQRAAATLPALLLHRPTLHGNNTHTGWSRVWIMLLWNAIAAVFGSLIPAPRTPDSNPLDCYLWGHLKALVYASPVDDMDTLRKRTVAGCKTICHFPGSRLCSRVCYNPATPPSLRRGLAPGITVFVPMGMPETVIERVLNSCHTHGSATEKMADTPVATSKRMSFRVRWRADQLNLSTRPALARLTSVHLVTHADSTQDQLHPRLTPPKTNSTIDWFLTKLTYTYTNKRLWANQKSESIEFIRVFGKYVTSDINTFCLLHATCGRKLVGEMCGNIERIIILLIRYFINTVFMTDITTCFILNINDQCVRLPAETERPTPAHCRLRDTSPLTAIVDARRRYGQHRGVGDPVQALVVLRKFTRLLLSALPQLLLATSTQERKSLSPVIGPQTATSPAGSLPDLRKWESCRTMPLVGRFSRGRFSFPRPCIPVLLHPHLFSSSSALKTSSGSLVASDEEPGHQLLLDQSSVAATSRSGVREQLGANGVVHPSCWKMKSGLVKQERAENHVFGYSAKHVPFGRSELVFGRFLLTLLAPYPHVVPVLQEISAQLPDGERCHTLDAIQKLSRESRRAAAARRAALKLRAAPAYRPRCELDRAPPPGADHDDYKEEEEEDDGPGLAGSCRAARSRQHQAWVGSPHVRWKDTANVPISLSRVWACVLTAGSGLPRRRLQRRRAGVSRGRLRPRHPPPPPRRWGFPARRGAAPADGGPTAEASRPWRGRPDVESWGGRPAQEEGYSHETLTFDILSFLLQGRSTNTYISQIPLTTSRPTVHLSPKSVVMLATAIGTAGLCRDSPLPASRRERQCMPPSSVRYWPHNGAICPDSLPVVRVPAHSYLEMHAPIAATSVLNTA
ncbi:hypothetical protein PR048_000520 [Dryococelus australis]|uniref:Uncharacterized protein n=1 Tax=Dryococelus australis TaxID=614101 RepID=A0ABQ9IG89_9NEOP|nr:hypothetical protein PR048_000520 [Dryococelus australis]